MPFYKIHELRLLRPKQNGSG